MHTPPGTSRKERRRVFRPGLGRDRSPPFSCLARAEPSEPAPPAPGVLGGVPPCCPSGCSVSGTAVSLLGWNVPPASHVGAEAGPGRAADGPRRSRRRDYDKRPGKDVERAVSLLLLFVLQQESEFGCSLPAISARPSSLGFALSREHVLKSFPLPNASFPHVRFPGPFCVTVVGPPPGPEMQRNFDT